MGHNYVVPEGKARKWAPIIDTVGAKRRLKARRVNRGLQLYPGIMSDDPRTLRMLESLARKLSDRFRPEIDATGVVGPEAIPGDFYQLLTVAGYGMNPISVPPVTNQAICDQLKLASGFTSARHKRIFDDLLRAMFSRSAPAKVSIRREASTGAPDYVNDVIKKKTELRAALNDLDHYLDRIDKGKLLDLYIEYNSPIVQTTGERTQADKVTFADGRAKSKDREVNDEQAARSGLKEGRRFAADKRVIIDGREIRDHFAGRRRSVYGTSFVPNYVCAAFCASWREVYLEDFEFTWKHRSPEHILEKMQRYQFLVGFDVKQFDQTVQSWFIDAMMRGLESYVDKRVVRLIELLFKAPYIVPYPWIDGTSDVAFDPLFGDDPFDISQFNMQVGLPSGISINPDTGKFAMMFAYLSLIDDYFGDVVEFGVDRVLRGEHPRYAALNMGDDCVLLTADEGFVQFCKKEKPSPYFALEEEKPISFLGNVPYRDEAGNLRLAPNLISYLVNWLVPEHGIDSFKRRNFWAIGERERRAHYAKSPSYNVVHGMFLDAFEETFGVSPASLTNEAYEQQRKYQNLSAIDALVLQNPDYLHYRYSDDQIDPEILDLLVTSLPADDVWPIISRYTDKRYQHG